jgi:hypothetical protein
VRVVGSHGVNDLIGRREPVGGTVGHEGPDPLGAGLLIAPGRVSVFSRDFTSETALTLGRAMIERFPVDGSAEGFDGNELDELVEQMLRMTRSFVVDPGTPPRTGPALRRYLTRWLAPSITVHHAASEEPSSF